MKDHIFRIFSNFFCSYPPSQSWDIYIWKYHTKITQKVFACRIFNVVTNDILHGMVCVCVFSSTKVNFKLNWHYDEHWTHEGGNYTYKKSTCKSKDKHTQKHKNVFIGQKKCLVLWPRFIFFTESFGKHLRSHFTKRHVDVLLHAT